MTLSTKKQKVEDDAPEAAPKLSKFQKIKLRVMASRRYKGRALDVPNEVCISKFNIITQNRNQKPTPAAKFLFFVSQQESSRAQCLDTALDKEERVRILTRKC